MACQKFTLINTGSTITTFNYQSCSDTQWRYNVNLYPGQTKSVWALNNTFQVPEFFLSSMVVENQGDFPPCDFNLFGGCYQYLVVNFSAETGPIQFTVCTNNGPDTITFPPLSSSFYPATEILNVSGEDYCISGGTAQEIEKTSVTLFAYSGSCCDEIVPTPTPTETVIPLVTPTPTETPLPSSTVIPLVTPTPTQASCFTTINFDITDCNDTIYWTDCCGTTGSTIIPSGTTAYSPPSGCLQYNSVTGPLTNVTYVVPCDCITPTPTPTLTITPSTTQSGCFTTINFDMTDCNDTIYWVDCCGTSGSTIIPSGTTAYSPPSGCLQYNSVTGPLTNVTYVVPCDCITPTPTPTNTETPTQTPVISGATETPTPTPTQTPVFSGVTETPTPTPTETPSISGVTSTPTPTNTETPSATPTQTPTSGCIFNDCYEFLIVTFTAATEIGGYYCEPGGPVYDSFMIAEASYPATQSLSASYCFSAGTWGASGDSITSLVYSGLCCEVTPTPTPTSTETPTPTETELIPTPTPSSTCAPTSTPTPTQTPTNQEPPPSPSCSPTYTPTPTCEPTGTPTPTCSPTKTCTPTPTPTIDCCEIQILTNISLDVDITHITVNGGIPEYVSGQPLPNTPGNGTTLCSTTAGTVDVRVSVFNSVPAQKLTLTDSLGNVYCQDITGTGPANFDYNEVTLNCVVPMTIIAEAGSCTVPPTPSPTQTLTNTPTNTPTPTSTDLSSLTTYTISGCSSSNVLVANLLSPGLAPNDVFYLDFTGATTTECYKIINKVNDTPTDGSSPVTFYASCAECLDQTTTVYSISGCTNMVTLNADLLSPNLFPGDVLYIEFTGSTLDGCYTVIEKMFNTVPTDTVLTNTTYSSCGLCEAAIVTPTPTVTETPTPTPSPTSTPTLSGLTVTVLEVGSDVVWSGSGSLNLNDLNFAGTDNISAGFAANAAIWITGPTDSNPSDAYSGSSITYPSDFGSGGVVASIGTGDIVGVLPGGSGRIIVVPSGYTSNTFIDSSTTYTGQTFLSMGLVEGIYSWTWGASPNESSINMTIGAP